MRRRTAGAPTPAIATTSTLAKGSVTHSSTGRKVGGGPGRLGNNAAVTARIRAASRGVRSGHFLRPGLGGWQ